jgi:hypothetical protein
MSEWIDCSMELPPINVVVNTRINDGNGIRNEQTLKRGGNLWFTPDGGMYVYYTPTQWKPITNPVEAEEQR